MCWGARVPSGGSVLPVIGPQCVTSWSCAEGQESLALCLWEGAVSLAGNGMAVHMSVRVSLRLLIQAGYDLDVQDHDGWTPLHAAAHWGVKEACSILAEALCNMDVRNKLVSRLGPCEAARLCQASEQLSGVWPRHGDTAPWPLSAQGLLSPKLQPAFCFH